MAAGLAQGAHVQLLFRRAVRGRPDDGSSRDADDVGELHADDNACLTHELRRRSRARFRAGRLYRLQTVTNGSYTGERSAARSTTSIPPRPRPTGRFGPVTTDSAAAVTNSVTGKTRSVVENGVRMVTGSADQLAVHGDGFPDRLHLRQPAPRHLTSARGPRPSRPTRQGRSRPVRHSRAGIGTSRGRRRGRPGSSATPLAVTTNPQLHYNASCTVEPRFDSGTLAAVVTKAGVTTNVTVQFHRLRPVHGHTV